MRLVARKALSLLKWLVSVLFGHKPLFVLMAAPAKPADLLPEQTLMLRGMGIMAAGAFKLLKGFVGPLLGHLLLHVRMTP